MGTREVELNICHVMWLRICLTREKRPKISNGTRHGGRGGPAKAGDGHRGGPAQTMRTVTASCRTDEEIGRKLPSIASKVRRLICGNQAPLAPLHIQSATR